ncbi:MAG: methylmalonyl-CoA mutase family protein [Beijerinckiaceae bacterium]|nr:methylmalonyl-CoA mutase family protein [Beijerinckiaceae bacterium]
MASDPHSPEPTFASAFPKADEAHWRGLVDRVLKGAAFEKLVGRSYDGVPIQPLYPRAPDAAPLASAHRGAWDMLARIDHPDAVAAHAQALTDLENGSNGLHLVFRSASGAHGFGLPVDAEAIERALESVVLEAGLNVLVDAGAAAERVAAHLEALVAARGIPESDVRISFGLDPVGDCARIGAPTIPATFSETVKRLRGNGFSAPLLVADGRFIHDAGGSEAQELGYVLGAAIAMMRALELAGLSLADARDALSFRLAADADEFLTIAKLRALRRLWARVEEACGLAPRPIVIHAETAWRMMTRRDPWVNLLRSTVAAFSAGLGGADHVSVMPFTQALGLPDAFARRLARNTQLILTEEANLGRVADPAAGAGGFETLTDELARAGWALFQQAEAAGGAVAHLPSLAASVAKVRAERLKNVARRKDPLTGTSEFPDLSERPVEVLAPLPAAADENSLFPAMRLAQEFERLRDRSDAVLAQSGRRPRIYLATLGTIADFTARAMFARSFFEAGGFETVFAKESETPEASAAGFAASEAKLACLCTSDALIAEKGPETAAKLAIAGARHIYSAGRPGANEAALREAGVVDFIYAGSDLVACLDSAHLSAS